MSVGLEQKFQNGIFLIQGVLVRHKTLIRDRAKQVRGMDVYLDQTPTGVTVDEIIEQIEAFGIQQYGVMWYEAATLEVGFTSYLGPFDDMQFVADRLNKMMPDGEFIHLVYKVQDNDAE